MSFQWVKVFLKIEQIQFLSKLVSRDSTLIRKDLSIRRMEEVLLKIILLHFRKSNEEKFHKGMMEIRQVTATHKEPG